jgi:glyoxylase-like metal-dependent hydrolase (beta-lactamase superfamily II)
MPTEVIETRRVHAGPFERITFVPLDPAQRAAHSVYRIGDTLIDAGSTRVADVLIEALRDNPPRRILLTHQHEDHAGGVAALRRAFGAIPVHAARGYLPILSTFDRVPEYRALYFGHPEPVEDGIGFDPGHAFEVDGLTLETLETPGHTPFHITYIARTGGVTYALTGDLFTSPAPLLAWYESAAEDTARSCRAVAAAGPNLHMLPSHGSIRPDGANTLLGLAALMDEKAAEIERAAARLGTRDCKRIALEVFGDADAPAVHHSGGELGFANFVRGVLDPVRSLPATLLE